MRTPGRLSTFWWRRSLKVRWYCTLFLRTLQLHGVKRYLGKLGVSSFQVGFASCRSCLNRFPTTMPNYLYLDANGQKQGPVNDQQLQVLAARGIITPDTPLATDTGHKGKAGQIRGLFNTAPSPFVQPAPQSVAVPAAEHHRGSSWQVTLIGVVLISVVGWIGWSIINNQQPAPANNGKTTELPAETKPVEVVEVDEMHTASAHTRRFPGGLFCKSLLAPAFYDASNPFRTGISSAKCEFLYVYFAKAF